MTSFPRRYGHRQPDSSQGDALMAGFIATFVIVSGFLVLGMLAQAYGVDSRTSYVDDWSR
jgi:hypothetical protein